MDEERPPPPHMIVKLFGCITIQGKALYKCIIHSLPAEVGWDSSESAVWRLVTMVLAVVSVMGAE